MRIQAFRAEFALDGSTATRKRSDSSANADHQSGRRRNRPRAAVSAIAGDTLTEQEPYKRWWSTAYVELKEGDFTLIVPVSPDQWSSVFAKDRLAVMAGPPSSSGCETSRLRPSVQLQSQLADHETTSGAWIE